MGVNNSKKKLRERKTTIIYCRANPISEIILVLRNYNKSELWLKTKYEWSIAEWEEYFTLKETAMLIDNQKRNE